MATTTTRYNLWLVIKRAPDVPHLWVAHCLDWDVVTTGTSIAHALRMAVEAISMVGLEDIARGAKHPRAPQEDWDELDALLSGGEPGTLAEALAGGAEDVVLATQLACLIRQERHPITAGMPDALEVRPPRPIPAVWTRPAA